MRYPFGEWLPDLPPLKSQGALTVCKNVVPVSGGYAPQASLQNLDSFALSAAPRGAVRGQLADGTNFFVAGTESTLERRIESGWSDVSRSDGYTPINQHRWSIVQFGSSVFATNYANEMQAIDLARDAQFANVPGAPRAQHLVVAENFLWAGDIFSSNLGVARDAVAWSAVANAYNWPDPNSDAATAVLSGESVLEGNGGIVHGIVSGSEVVAILQEGAIHRADFVGNDVVWRITRMIVDHGLAIKGAAIAINRGVLFIAEDGFRLFNYTTSENVGKDRINDFFFGDYDNDYPDSVSMRRDPLQTRVHVSYAGSGNTGGVPNRMLVWDWVVDRWSVVYPGDHYDLIGAGGIAASLDSPDIALDQDTLDGMIVDGKDRDYGDLTLDERQLGSGRVTLGAFDSTFQLSSFSGANLPGVLETGDLELTPGFRSMLTSVRPQVDGEETSVQVAGIDRRADDTTEIKYGPVSKMTRSGDNPVRKDARYHRLRFNLSESFTEATEFDCKFMKTGTR